MEPVQLRCKHTSSVIYGRLWLEQANNPVVKFEVKLCDVCFAGMLINIDECTEVDVAVLLRDRMAEYIRPSQKA